MSQLRSGRGAKAQKQKSTRGSGTRRTTGKSGAGRGVYVQQPKNDIFVVLLGVALGAMVLGCLFLVVKLNAYGFDVSGPGL